MEPAANTPPAIGPKAPIERSTIDFPARERIEERSIMLALIQPFHSIVRARFRKGLETQGCC